MLSIEQVETELTPTMASIEDALNSVIERAQEAKRLAIAEAVELEQRAATLRLEADKAPQADDIKADIVKGRNDALTAIKQAIIDWSASEAPQSNLVQLGAMQAVQTMYTRCRTFDDCINHLNGRGKLAVIMIAVGFLDNPVPHIIPELDKMKPFMLYEIAESMNLADGFVDEAKRYKALLDKVESLNLPLFATVKQDLSKGRYVANLSLDDFKLVYGTTAQEALNSFNASKSHPELASGLAAITSAMAYKIWQSKNAVVM